MELINYCQGGDLAALQAYCAQANVTAEYVRLSYALLLTCCWGHLELARWLQQSFQLDAFDVRMHENTILLWTCENGHLEVARWMQQTFQLTAADARAQRNFALLEACASGHLDVAQWLQQTFQLTALDARSSDNYAARRACEGGHLEVLRWLQRTWGIPPDEQVTIIAYAADNPKAKACVAYLRDLRMWSPRTHPEYSLAIRRLALYLLLIYQRLTRGPLPYLPPELWLHILSYLSVR